MGEMRHEEIKHKFYPIGVKIKVSLKHIAINFIFFYVMYQDIIFHLNYLFTLLKSLELVICILLLYHIFACHEIHNLMIDDKLV
jgi:hypothetical protein